MVRIDPPESQVLWWDPFWVRKMPWVIPEFAVDSTEN
jgi:hypothetical protein